jgi:DNA-binding CsgD family transcriptional regulator
MNWIALSRLLMDRIGHPTLVVDAHGKIISSNQELQGVLGLSGPQLEGKTWAEIFGSSSGHPDWLERAVAGTLLHQREVAHIARRRRIHFDFHLAPILDANEPAVLAVATSCYPLGAVPDDSTPRSVDYEVAQNHGGGFDLRRVADDGELVPVYGELPCYRFFHAASQPCGDCPLLRPSTDPWPRRAVRYRRANGGESCFEVIEAEPAGESVVRLRILSLPEQTLQAIHQNRLQTLARRAQLSERETEVLGHLLAGRGTQEMAELLGVAPRTIKYHQANVLGKLGVDSRLDLLRLVL